MQHVQGPRAQGHTGQVLKVKSFWPPEEGAVASGGRSKSEKACQRVTLEVSSWKELGVSYESSSRAQDGRGWQGRKQERWWGPDHRGSGFIL